jgi:glycosyltransferase involved in cell wall biosynthesis
VEVDCFLTTSLADAPTSLRDDDGIRLFCRPARWRWDRWYSRTPMTTFVTRHGARGLAQRSLMGLIAEEHQRRPYDLLYQFSQIELFGVRRRRAALPPIVLHPEVHAAGELRWHRRESALAARGEARYRRLAARTVLTGRAIRQRRDIRLVRRVIAPSAAFALHLALDYGVPLDRISVVPNPIDLERFTPRAGAPSHDGHHRPITALFVSRLSVRKGLDLVIGLSHRLRDLAGEVRIEVIGGRTLWSDYTALLPDLHPEVAVYRGVLEVEELAEAYARADLLLQPSQYEPFALTVAEALATGVPVVTSSEVGASEGVDRGCCTVFTAGDLDALERAVREVLARLRAGEGPAMARLARAEAERLFAPPRVADGIARSLEAAVAGRDLP